MWKHILKINANVQINNTEEEKISWKYYALTILSKVCNKTGAIPQKQVGAFFQIGIAYSCKQ